MRPPGRSGRGPLEGARARHPRRPVGGRRPRAPRGAAGDDVGRRPRGRQRWPHLGASSGESSTASRSPRAHECRFDADGAPGRHPRARAAAALEHDAAHRPRPRLRSALGTQHWRSGALPPSAAARGSRGPTNPVGCEAPCDVVRSERRARSGSGVLWDVAPAHPRHQSALVRLLTVSSRTHRKRPGGANAAHSGAGVHVVTAAPPEVLEACGDRFVVTEPGLPRTPRRLRRGRMSPARVADQAAAAASTSATRPDRATTAKPETGVAIVARDLLFVRGARHRRRARLPFVAEYAGVLESLGRAATLGAGCGA